jgi:hypothetical protein
VQFSKTWSDAIRQKEFGLIADWFIFYFFVTGLAAIVLVGVAAGTGGITLSRVPEMAPAAPAVQTPLSHEDVAKKRRPDAAANRAPSGGVSAEQTPVPGGAAQGLRVFSLSLLLAGACAATGWLFGLLFGIPRSLAQPAAATAPVTNTSPASTAANGTTAQTSRVNTNLEEISDWLTKTLVGVGLTQLGNLPKALGDLAFNINTYGFDWGHNGQLLALGLLFYFAPGGFWLGYVGTRTFLTGLFGGIDSLSREAIDLAADPSPSNLRLSDFGIEDPQGKLKAIDDTLLRLPLQSLSSNKEVTAWAAAQARAKNYEVARTATESALKLDPENSDIKQQLAIIQLAMRRPDDSAALLASAPDRPAKVFAALYEAPPDGFKKAIALGEKLAQDDAYKNVASLHAWLACAYGQQYGYEKARQADPQALETIRTKAIAEIETAIRLEPSMRERLHSYWKPGPDSIDDDLRSFPADDPKLTELLEPPSVNPG